MPAGQPQLRIDDDPYGIRSGTAPYGKLRVIGTYRARADEHRVGEGPHPMAMQEVRLAGDPAGVAALSCDMAVEALPDMSDHEPAGVGVATRKIEVELCRDVVRQL